MNPTNKIRGSRKTLINAGFSTILFWAGVYSASLFGGYYGVKKGAELKSKIEYSQMNPEHQVLFDKIPHLKRLSHSYRNQEGKKVRPRDILAESIQGPKAIEFGKEILKTAEEYYGEGEFETLEDKIALAQETIFIARTKLQRFDRGGEGNYTLRYEYNEEKERLKQEILNTTMIEEDKKESIRQIENSTFETRTDSIQTFDQFYGPKEGLKFAGDCDDFSMALETTYHVIKLQAGLSSKKNHFYQALSEGFKHYHLFILNVRGHAQNLEIILKDKSELKPIEPQAVNQKDEFGAILDSAFVYKIMKGGIGYDASIIQGIYGLDFCAIVLK